MCDNFWLATGCHALLSANFKPAEATLCPLDTLLASLRPASGPDLDDLWWSMPGRCVLAQRLSGPMFPLLLAVCACARSVSARCSCGLQGWHHGAVPGELTEANISVRVWTLAPCCLRCIGGLCERPASGALLTVTRLVHCRSSAWRCGCSRLPRVCELT